MNCNKCDVIISIGEEREHNHQIVCEDCYIDAIAPAKFCDPWADYMAKSCVNTNPYMELTTNQSLIINVLKEYDGLDPISLMEKLKGQIAPEDGERDCAALHRMGKISIENNDGSVCIKLK